MKVNGEAGRNFFLLTTARMIGGNVLTSLTHVGKAARNCRSSAAGLYVALYYLGGCMGSILPGFLWKQAGWPGCVAVITAMQFLTVMIANKFRRD